MNKKYEIKLSEAELLTIIQALQNENYLIKREVLKELSMKQFKNQKEFNEKYREIIESSISYILEKELTKLI